MSNPDVLLAQTTAITIAALNTGNLSNGDVFAFVAETYRALDQASVPSAPKIEVPAPEPAVPVKQSIKRDYIVCLEDGQKLKMLKRYLRTQHGLTPDAYRAKWGLPRDYPMVAPAYAETRRRLAVEHGLGQKKPAPAKRGRKAA